MKYKKIFVLKKIIKQENYCQTFETNRLVNLIAEKRQGNNPESKLKTYTVFTVDQVYEISCFPGKSTEQPELYGSS